MNAFVSMLLALVVPGAGHFYLGRRVRAVAFFCIIVFMFAVGLAVEGGIYTLSESSGNALKILASLGSMGSGVLYVLANWRHAYGNVTSQTFEYGKTFTLTAGVMNLLLMIDCFDIARGRKS